MSTTAGDQESPTVDMPTPDNEPASPLETKSESEHFVVRVAAYEASPSTAATTQLVAVEPQTVEQAAVFQEAPPGEASKPTVPLPIYDLQETRNPTRQSRVAQKKKKPRGAEIELTNAPMAAAEGAYIPAVVDLDDDIRQLRAALVQKLETQNDQLRDMLARFENK